MEIGGQGRLVVLGDEDIVRTALGQIIGELALGQQRVGGQGLAGEVEGIEYRDRHPDLVGAFQLLAATDRQRGDFFWVWQTLD